MNAQMRDPGHQNARRRRAARVSMSKTISPGLTITAHLAFGVLGPRRCFAVKLGEPFSPGKGENSPR